MRYAIINADNKVVNIIVTSMDFACPRNHLKVESDTAKINDVYDVEAGTFSHGE